MDEGTRTLRSTEELRAFAHPLRMAMYEALVANGPLTATQLGGRLGQSPAACSYHLRQLAQVGLIRETASSGGRNRPWAATSRRLQWGSDDADSLSAQALADEFRDVWLDRQVRLVRQALGSASEDAPQEWAEASMTNSALAWMTPGELVEVRQVLQDLLARFDGRMGGDAARPDGARLVRLLAFGVLADGPPGAAP